ncbi:unnamed protein product [Moneuplotes crassus]|uniref:Uncharacterized protein n=1 Tax=Euplotes crassus TaxID=5936 RepID=A0AAD2D8E2_EUPCR|nr:unnamed protein product [Moneuplotes crassus]
MLAGGQLETKTEEDALFQHNFKNLQVLDTVEFNLRKTLYKASHACMHRCGVLKNAFEYTQSRDFDMDESLKNEKKCFGNCLNIHAEAYFKFFDKQIIHQQEDVKKIEEINISGNKGSMLLGGGMEEPHYDIPDIK